MQSAEENIHIIAATNGFLSFFLLWLAVLGGLVLRNGWALTRVRHSTLLAVHTTLALLGLTLGTVHGFAQLAVPAGKVNLIDVMVPFTNTYDPIGIGVGVIGLEIMIAVALSITIQRLLGYSRWRALHALSYAAFTAVVAHILISGTDMEDPLRWGLVLGAWVVVMVLWGLTSPMMVNLRRRKGEQAAGRQRAEEISVNVNAQRCVQFGFCEHEAPEIFNLRSDGRLAYRATVTTEEATAVIRAAEVCPARAILLSRVPTSVMTARPEDPIDRPETAVEAPMVAGGPGRPGPGGQYAGGPPAGPYGVIPSRPGPGGPPGGYEAPEPYDEPGYREPGYGEPGYGDPPYSGAPYDAPYSGVPYSGPPRSGPPAPPEPPAGPPGSPVGAPRGKGGTVTKFQRRRGGGK